MFSHYVWYFGIGTVILQNEEICFLELYLLNAFLAIVLSSHFRLMRIMLMKLSRIMSTRSALLSTY